MSWKLVLVAFVAWSSLWILMAPLVAAEGEPNSGPGRFGGPGSGPGPFPELERRIREVAERQEQIARQLGALQERQEQMLRRFGAGQEPPGPMAAPGPLRMRGQNQPGGPEPVPFPPRPFKDIRHALGLISLVWIVFNILLAVWIYTDIRKRGEGSGIFVALAILAGIPAAIIYSLVRLGDKKA